MSNKLLDKLGLTSLITKITNTFAKKSEVNSLKSILNVTATETKGCFLIGEKNFTTNTGVSDMLVCFGKLKLIRRTKYQNGEYTEEDANIFEGISSFGGNQILIGVGFANEYNSNYYSAPIEIIPVYTTVDSQRRYSKFYAVTDSSHASDMSGYYIAIIGKLTN